MSMNKRLSVLKDVKKAVVKIGSSVLTNGQGAILPDVFDKIASQVSMVSRGGIDIILVSSGAIASGMQKLGMAKRPEEISMKQAIAACGQSTLIWNYEKAFSGHGRHVAQILLTHDGLSDRKRFLNARKTLFTLLEMNIVPVVNDTVAVEEIMLGDNDNLAALVTSLIEADLLIILTDTEGLYSKDPRSNADAELLSLIDEIGEEIESIAGETLGKTTVGGMRTKIEAARTAAAYGVPTIIANGMRDSILEQIFRGEDVGTFFVPSIKSLKGRKHWIAFTLKSAGRIVIDPGAERAISRSGKSLLPSGIVDVKGDFGIGDSVTCVGENGAEIARGLTSYSSEDIRKIMGAKTADIERILGYNFGDAVIHRDDLAIITG